MKKHSCLKHCGTRLTGVALSCVLLLSACSKIDEAPVSVSSGTPLIISTDNSFSSENFVSPVYEALSPQERVLYDKVRDAVMNFEDFVTFNPPQSRDTVQKIYKLVYTQERKYFWLSNIFYTPYDQVSTLRLNYLYSREDAEFKRAELDLAASTVIGALSEGTSDFEAVVRFHEHIVKNCTFSTENEHVNSAYGVLVTGFGQCEGYAAAMAYLCDKAGIPNYVVCGKNADNETHAWNKIMVGGEWYNADCTWDDPILKRNDPNFVRHDFLLVKDIEIEGITHFTDELYEGLPYCTTDSLNYFRGVGLMYDEAQAGIDKLKEQVRQKGLSGEREVEVRFSDPADYQSVISRLFDNNGMKDIIEETNENYGTKILSAYKHNNDNMNIVHISLIYESDEN